MEKPVKYDPEQDAILDVNNRVVVRFNRDAGVRYCDAKEIVNAINAEKGSSEFMNKPKYRTFIKAIADSNRLDDETKVKAIQGMLRIQERKQAGYDPDKTFAGVFLWGLTVEGHSFWDHINNTVFEN